MINVNTHAAKSQLSALLRAVEERDETVVICRNGKPIAELKPVPRSNKNPLRHHPELAGKILYDPMEPASEEEWPPEAR